MSSTQQPPGLRSLFVLAWPVVLARSSQSVIGFCDALMIASLGDDALAATTTGAINAFSLAILPMGIVFIVQSFSAQLKGKGDLLGARRYAWYGLGLAAAVMVLAALATPLVGPVLGLLDYQPAVHRQMTDYLVIRLFAMGAVVGIEALGNWYGGLGNTRLQMIAGVLAMVVNVALNWVLIGGNLGAPALGVTGAAIASVIASWAGFGLLALAFGRGWGAERARGPLGLSVAELWRMLRFGIPNGINWFFEFAALTLFINVVVAGLGTAVHAAMMVVIQINSVSFMPAFGLTSAGAILVGQAIGAGRHGDVPRIVRRTGLVTAGWQCGVGMLYLLIPGVLMGWFAASGAPSLTFLEVGTTLLAISAAWQLFDAIAMTMSEALRAAGDTAWSMWARIALAWLVFTPGSILAVSVLGGGPIAAILCMVVYMATLALAMSWRFYSGAWRNIDLTGSPVSR